MEEEILLLQTIIQKIEDIFNFLQYQLGFMVGLFIMEKIFKIIKKFGGNK